MNAQKLRGREKILSARIATIFVLATLLLSAPLAKAVPITIEITGEVTSLEGDVGSVPSTIYAGVSFTGTYTYESSTSDSDASPYIGEYRHNSPCGISLFLGGYEFKTAANHIGKFNISIHNDDPQANLWDYYMVESDEIISAPPVGFSVDHIRWVLGDITHAALDSDALPITAPVLTDWGYNLLRISGSGDLGGLLIKGTVTQAVPEPLTGVLMVIGVLFFRRRRKTIKAQKPRVRKGVLSAPIVTIFVLAILLLPAPLAQAVPVTIQITGEITSVTSEHVPTDLTDGINVGDIFTGTYIYDTATQGSEVLPHLIEYKHNSPYGINVSVGGFDFRTVQCHTGQFVVEIGDNYTVNNMYDSYAITSTENITLTGYPSYTIEWILSDSTHNALSSTALPETAPSLNDWDWYRFRIGGSEYVQQGDYWRGFRLEGTVTQAVPEPFTGVLMMMGVSFFRRRRKTMKAQKLRGRNNILSPLIATFLVFAILLFSAPLAQAVPITIEITGEITDGYGSLWGGSIYEGALFTGVYNYNSSTPDTSERSDIGLYVHDSPYGLNVSLGGFEFKTVQNHTGQFNITITDNGPNADSYRVESNQNDLLSNGATVSIFSWSLHGPDSMISSTELPFDAPTVSQWPGNILFISGKDVLGNGYLIEGTVTQAVPEPLSVILMVAGMLFIRRRQ